MIKVYEKAYKDLFLMIAETYYRTSKKYFKIEGLLKNFDHFITDEALKKTSPENMLDVIERRVDWLINLLYEVGDRNIGSKQIDTYDLVCRDMEITKNNTSKAATTLVNFVNKKREEKMEADNWQHLKMKKIDTGLTSLNTNFGTLVSEVKTKDMDLLDLQKELKIANEEISYLKDKN